MQSNWRSKMSYVSTAISIAMVIYVLGLMGYLLLKAQELATGKIQKDLDFCLTTKVIDDSTKVERVTTIFNTLNIKELAVDEMNLFYNSAISHLDSIEADYEKKNVFENFAKSLMNREN